MLLKRIPETLKDLFDDVEEPSTFSILPDISVILFNLHDYGLNYHHIGYVVSKANSFINSMNGEEKVAILKALSRALVVEALARTLKNKVHSPHFPIKPLFLFICYSISF